MVHAVFFCESYHSWESYQQGKFGVSDESGDPGEIGDYDESRNFCKSGNSRLYGDSGDSSEFGDDDKLGKTGDVYESSDFINMMLLVIQVNLLIILNSEKLVKLVLILNIGILMIQVKSSNFDESVDSGGISEDDETLHF